MLLTVATLVAAGGSAPAAAVVAAGPVVAAGANGFGALGDGTFTDRFVPAASGLTDAIQVSAGGGHSLALKSDGTVWAWGDNFFGQLGDGSGIEQESPVQVAGLADVVGVAAGLDHSLAVKSDGTVWAWGDNFAGQIGDGTTTQRDTPVQVSGLSTAVDVQAGESHSLALLSDGSVQAWGDNTFGQLGDGTTTQRDTPVAVSGLAGVDEVAAGNFHSLAVLSDDTARAWGDNFFGQLGDGTTTQRETPVAVSGLTGVASVAAGDAHSLALLSNGTVQSWGDNIDGQLGDGTNTSSLTPVAVSGLAGVDMVAAGENHSLAVLADATARSWGDNGSGQLGDGTTTNRNSPVPVAGLTDHAAAAGGSSHTLWITGSETWGMLRAITDPAVPSQIAVNGVPADTWGLTWVKRNAGEHTVSFRNVGGFGTPSDQVVQVTAGATTTVTGSFTQYGTLRVTTEPALPGTISVDGIRRNDWGMWTDLPTGMHEVCFGPVEGHDPPPCENVELTAGAQTDVTGTYTASSAPAPTGTGFLEVTTSPAVPSQITIDGVPADSWGVFVSLPPGSYTVGFTDVEGFTTPDDQVVEITEGATASITGTFVERGFLRVTTSPAVSATIFVDGVPRNDWGMWTDLPVGTHHVCFGAVDGMTTPPCEVAEVTAGATTHVTGAFA